MNKKQIIRKTEEFVKKNMKGDVGHDFFHIERVRRNALHIGKKEKADLLVVELGALLHDVADFKFHGGDDKASGRVTKQLLSGLKADPGIIDRIIHIVDNVSFKGAKVKSKMRSLEGKIVQDADRLDALGAIGIARNMVYAGYMKLPIYDPYKKPVLHKSFESYKKNESSGIIHFYEKLLLLKNLMNTKTGKELAIRRHKFMEQYLKEFFAEWKGIQ